MKIEELFDEWGKDSQIDASEITAEASKIPQLHHKYYKLYLTEKMLLRKLDAQLKTLKLDKYEFYTQGPHKETPKEWKLPAVGRILKADVDKYMDADKEIIQLSLEIGLKKEKIDLLYSILKTLSERGFLLNTMVKWEQFKAGL